MTSISGFTKKISLIVLFALLSSSCQSEFRLVEPDFTLEPCPDYFHYGIRLDDLPEFLFYVWPIPNSEVSLSCYDLTMQSDDPSQIATGRGVGVHLFVGAIDVLLDSPDNVYQRIDLYIDDEKISSETIIITNGGVELIYLDGVGNVTPTGKSADYQISWAPFLSSGFHEARVEITTDNGEILTYEWTFTIVDG